MSTTILFSDIIEGERFRHVTKYGDLEALQHSLTTYGSIHPIVLDKAADGKFRLIAGGRRYRAMKALKIEKLYKGSILTPGKLGFLFKDEVSEHLRRELELEENLQRLDMEWVDVVMSIYNIHRLRKAQNAGAWGGKQTAKLLKTSEASISHVLRAAKALLAKDEEIMKCQNLDQTIAVFIKRKEDETLAEMQRRAAARHPKHVVEEVQSVLASASPNQDGLAAALAILGKRQKDSPTETLSPGPAPTTKGEILRIPLSLMFQLGDFRNLKFPEVDHIVTDIPYGIEMDNLTDALVSDVKDEHDVQDNLLLMQPFLKAAYEAVKPRGFCVFWYDLDHHEKLQAWAVAAGWRVQRWPFIAVKTSPARNQAAQYNTTKNYECCMFLRKDDKTVLRKPISSSWKPYDFAAERALYNNPFAKPSELWKDIYDAIAFPGQSVLDPFAGEMSACRAAANCGLVPYGIELKEQHYNRGIQHMQTIYKLIHKNNCEFV